VREIFGQKMAVPQFVPPRIRPTEQNFLIRPIEQKFLIRPISKCPTE